MFNQLVFVPCEPPTGNTVRVIDSDGWPLDVEGQPVGRVRGRLAVAARWLRSAAGRSRVRFADGSEGWVCQEPEPPDVFTPLDQGA
jgi:hypothetical protein